MELSRGPTEVEPPGGQHTARSPLCLLYSALPCLLLRLLMSFFDTFFSLPQPGRVLEGAGMWAEPQALQLVLSAF